MTEERNVEVEGKVYTVVISDDEEALLKAKACGRAVVGLWHGQDLDAADYLVGSVEDIDDDYLERVIRRSFNMPWIIAETSRLLIRELTPGDEEMIPHEETDTGSDRVFYTGEGIEGYVRYQYGLYECGIWALIEKKSGDLAGLAGLNYGKDMKDLRCNMDDTETISDDLTCLELGYHVFEPYRRKGYAVEACRKIIDLAGNCIIYAKIDASNEASVRTALDCGLKLTDLTCNEEGRCRSLYVLNSR